MRRKSKESRSGSNNNSRINSNTKICEKKEYLASKLDLKTALKLLEDRDTESVNNSEDSSTPDDFTSPIPNVICMDDYSYERYRSSKYSDLSENGRKNQNGSIELKAEKKMTGTKLNMRRNSKSPNNKKFPTRKIGGNNINNNNNITTENTYSRNNNNNVKKMSKRRISSEMMNEKDEIVDSPIKKSKLKEICDDRMNNIHLNSNINNNNRNGYHRGSMSSNNVMIPQNKKMNIISPKKSHTVINILSSESPHRDYNQNNFYNNHNINHNNNFGDNHNDNNHNNNNSNMNINSKFINQKNDFYNNNNNNNTKNNFYNNNNDNANNNGNTVLPSIKYLLNRKYEDLPSSVSCVNETPSDQWNQNYTSPISPITRSPLRFKTLGIYDDEMMRLPMQRSKLSMTDSQSINLDLTQLTSPVKKPPVSNTNGGPPRFSTSSNNRLVNRLFVYNNNNYNNTGKNNNDYNNNNYINNNGSNNYNTINNGNNNYDYNKQNVNNKNTQNNHNGNYSNNNNNNSHNEGHVKNKNENINNISKKFVINNNNNNCNNRNNSILNNNNNNYNNHNNKRISSSVTFPFNTNTNKNSVNKNSINNKNTNKNTRTIEKGSAWESYLSNCTETNHTNLIHKRDLPHLNINDFPSKKSKSSSSIHVNGSRPSISNPSSVPLSKSFNSAPTVFVDLVSDEEPLVDENTFVN